MDKFNTLCLEGGGIWGVAYVGAIEELQKHIDVYKLETYCGTSVGAIF